MSIWNALAAGGAALNIAGMCLAVALLLTAPADAIWLVIVLTLNSLGFGLCLWGAIP